MRVIRIALYACMAIVLAGGWAFLYWQSSGLELDAANGARGALNGLRAIDARWNDQLVGARLLGAGGKAPLEPARHGSAYAALEVQALRLTHPQIGSALAGREVSQHLRELGAMTGGPAPFTKADRSNFLVALDAAAHAALRVAKEE